MKKIAVSTVKAFVAGKETDNTITVTYPIDDSEFAVTIKTKLTTEEKGTFIRRVLSGCFDAQNNYRPEYVTPMLRATILQICTNIPVITLKGERSDDGAALMDLDAMDALYCAMNMDQIDNADYIKLLNEMVQLTYSAVEWRCARIRADIQAAGSNALREIAEQITRVLETLDTEKLMEYAATLSKQTEGLDTRNLVSTILEVDQRTRE